ncbi:hypothetical protein ABK040_015792 [Willaertia magna]
MKLSIVTSSIKHVASSLFSQITGHSGKGGNHYEQVASSKSGGNTKSFLSEMGFISPPGLTKVNQLLVGVLGAFVGILITFITGFILIEVLFSKVFAIIFGLLMIIMSSLFMIKTAVSNKNEVSYHSRTTIYIILTICIFSGLLLIILYGTNWFNLQFQPYSKVIIRNEKYEKIGKSLLNESSKFQWNVLWNFIIGNSIFFLAVFIFCEFITNGILPICQCCYLNTFYRRSTSNYFIFILCLLFSSCIIGSAFSIFISIVKDATVSTSENISSFTILDLIYRNLLINQLFIVFPFGIVFGCILGLIFQFNYLKDYFDLQEERSVMEGGNSLIKTTSLNLSDDDDEDKEDEIAIQSIHIQK